MKKIIALVLTTTLLLTSFVAAVIVGSAADEAYVTDGLVANYDASKIADGSTTWTDDSGNGNDIVNVPNTDTCYFKDGVYHNNSTKVSFPDAINTAIGGDEFTVEMVIDNVESLGTSWNTFINCPNDDFSLFRHVANNNLVVKLHPNARPSSSNNTGLDLLADSTVSVTFKVGGKSRLYVNGELISEVDCASALNPDGMYFGHDADTKNFSADYKAMRFYDRELTAAEISANYAVDSKAEAPVVSTPSEEPSAEPSTPVVSGNLVNVAAGKSYTTDELFRQNTSTWSWDENADVAYPDEDGKTLTDGLFSDGVTNYLDSAWMGFHTGTATTAENGYAWMNVDLGESEDIKKLVLYMGGKGRTGGISLPEKVEFLVSDDGENWTSLGEAVIPEDNDTLVEGAIVLELDKAVSAKYVRAEVTREKGWMFVSEFEAYAVKEVSEPSTPEVPTTSDNGIVALAVIASLAVAGAVIVKKSR